MKNVDFLDIFLTILGGLLFISILTVIVLGSYGVVHDIKVDSKIDSYLDCEPMSYPELVEHLTNDYEFEKAVYEATHSDVDWNYQAALCAKEYISNNKNLTYNSLMTELMKRGFTEEQATFACYHNGIEYREVKK